MKKRPIRKFEQIDYIDESILPSELKPDYEL